MLKEPDEQQITPQDGSITPELAEELRAAMKRPYLPAGQLFFSPAEVASVLGVSEKTIYGQAAHGRIFYGRVFRQIKIPRTEVERLIGIMCGDDYENG